jgi:hypothetical protein
MRKFISLNVFTTAAHGDCTNGGVSCGAVNLFMEHPEGCYTEERLIELGNGHLLFRGEQAGNDYFRLMPLTPPKAGMVGPMYGGNLATSSDSRCRHIYHIHDRYETPELNAILSR